MISVSSSVGQTAGKTGVRLPSFFRVTGQFAIQPLTRGFPPNKLTPYANSKPTPYAKNGKGESCRKLAAERKTGNDTLAPQTTSLIKQFHTNARLRRCVFWINTTIPFLA